MDENIDFGEEKLVYNDSEARGGIARFIISISKGRIKDEAQAQFVMMGIVIVVIIVSMILFFSARTPTPEVIPGIDDLPPGGF